jgi:hypothetical protein
VHPLPDEPSPKDQLQDTGETPQVDVAVKLSDTPASTGFGLALAMTLSALSTVMDVEREVDFEPTESVTVTVVVNVPVEV